MKRLILFFLFVSVIVSQEYHVDKTKDNFVKFISDAPLEDFEGISNSIDGYMYLKSVEDLNDNQLYFEVDLTTLDTGIELRNRHMRDNYLETEKYRFTFFEGRISQIEKVSDQKHSVEVNGTLFIHGVTNEINVQGVLTSADYGYLVESEFIVALSDYKIDIPQLMFMKINEEMKLQLRFHLKKIVRPEE